MMPLEEPACVRFPSLPDDEVHEISDQSALFHWSKPQDEVSPAELDRGLRMLLFDGVCSQAMGALTGGAFLVAFALVLGAPNAVIGLLAAIGPLTQILQIPAIFLVDRTARRKALVVVNSFISRLTLLLIGFLPWTVPAEHRVKFLVMCLLVYFGLGAISGCAFNSWMHELVPGAIRGRYFGTRMMAATAAGAALMLIAGFGVDAAQKAGWEPQTIYSVLFLTGASAGLVGAFFLSRIPEPRMKPQVPVGLGTVLAEPFRDANFRKLLIFLGFWNFAVNLAAPFFVVYMLLRLELSMSIVLSLSVLSQFVNILFFRLWGRLADEFTNKSVLSVSGPLFILSIFLWPFLTLPEEHFLTVPLLIVIHVLAGLSTAGVSLCAGNIALKAAPTGKATSFLAANALVSGAAATVAPILAGLAADGFAGQRLTLTLRWSALGVDDPLFDLPAIDIQGLDFLFIIAVVFGLYALHRLLAVREEGEVSERLVITELYGEVRKAVRHVSNVAGLRHLYYFPYTRLEQLAAKTAAARGKPKQRGLDSA